MSPADLYPATLALDTHFLDRLFRRDVHNLHQVPLVGLTCGFIGHHLLERDHVFVCLDADLRSWVGGGGDQRVVRDATLSWT